MGTQTRRLVILSLIACVASLLSACGNSSSAPPSDEGPCPTDCECSDGDGDQDASETENETPELPEEDGDREFDEEMELEEEAEAETEEEIIEWPLYSHDGWFIRDKQGRALILRGINATNYYKYRPMEDPVYMGREGFERIARLGFNAVRLLVQWHALEPEPDVFDPDYLDKIEERIRWAADAGLYVQIDMHQDLYGEGFGDNGAPAWTCDQSYYDSYVFREPWTINYFSNEITACFDQYWQNRELWGHQARAAAEVGRRVADLDNVIGYDVFNEPFWGSMNWRDLERDILWDYYHLFAETVTGALPQRLIFFQSTIMFNLNLVTHFPGEFTEFAGVFAPHYYYPSLEIIFNYDGNAEAVRRDISKAAAEARRLGTPLSFGEMGGFNATPNLDEYLFVLYGAFDKEMVGAFMWDYSIYAKGLLLNPEGELIPHARAILRPTPSAVAGTPLDFSWDYVNLTFTLTWEEDARAGDTEILLPAWIKNGGFTVTLDGKELRPTLNANETRLVLPGGQGGQRHVKLVANRLYSPTLNGD